MDPMAMAQGMYGGFGGQGMGMNGMNMGMGFNNAGQGAFGGGFNGQPAAWNAGPDKFNQNAYGGQAGMGGGDFGANTGYGGYNMPPHQGNFNQMHQHQYPNNDFHHGHHGQGFQYRGRGRGRGYLNAGRGPGNYNQNFFQGNQNQNQTNYEPFHQQTPAQVTRRGSPSYGPQQDQPSHEQQDQSTTGSQQDAKPEETATGLTAEEQLNKELDPGDADDDDDKPLESATKEDRGKEEQENEGQVKEEQVEQPAAEPDATTEAPEETQPEAAPELKEEKPKPIPTILSDEASKSELPAADPSVSIPPTMMPPPSPMIPTGPSALHADQALDTSPRGRGAGRGFYGSPDYRGGSRGRGSAYPPHNNFPRVTPPVVKAVVPPSAPKGLGVEGAPKAPKALREGQPNTGIKGFSIVGRASVATQARPSGSTATRRYAPLRLLRLQNALLTANPVHPANARVPPPSINPLIIDIIATVPPVLPTIASMRGDESATVVIREGTTTRTAIRKSTKAHALESHQPIHQQSEVRIEAVVNTKRRRKGTAALTDPTDPTVTGVEKRTRNIEAAESARSPQKSLSTARADEAFLTLIVIPMAMRKRTKNHLNHRESGARMMRSTRTIAVNGSALDATTKTQPKRKKAVTAPPNPASVTSKNQYPTTTDLPKVLLPKKRKVETRRNKTGGP